ncbi:hypothetical protein AVEN_108638-1 [Araneus ventricosus]|uniref:Uncharacterized protein n=1 Tax=Araneus ventricosus TaxID=182803 RepID=A0A4Y2NX87_ARAVE|nr:hypothetical protein AVEN_108638-1 [Araneus ventricosus]
MTCLSGMAEKWNGVAATIIDSPRNAIVTPSTVMNGRGHPRPFRSTQIRPLPVTAILDFLGEHRTPSPIAYLPLPLSWPCNQTERRISNLPLQF